MEQLEQGAPPHGPWAQVQGLDVQALIRGFATGFSVPGHTQPGFGLQTPQFKVIFRGVTVNNEENNEISEPLETCYDWSGVMTAVLGATRCYQELEEVEGKVELAVTKWLPTFSGWGLLFSILPLERTRNFMMALIFTSANWNEATGGPRTDLKVFHTVRYVYEHIHSRSLASLVPTVAIWFEELEQDSEVSIKDDERRKLLTINIEGQWNLEVQFIVEKKRVNADLEDLAAKAVAREVRRREGLHELEVPVSLRPRLLEKFSDQEWVRGGRGYNNLGEDDTDDMDDTELMVTLQIFDDDSSEMEEDDQKTESDDTLEYAHWALYCLLLLFTYLCS